MKVFSRVLDLLTVPCYLAMVLALVIAAPLVAGLKPVVVLTGSMEPSMPVGSVIYTSTARFTDIHPGDSISFALGDDDQALVTHRVMARDDISQSFTTKGDANPQADPNPVSYQQVRGKVHPWRLPLMGYLVLLFRKPPVLASAFLILLLKWIMNILSDPQKPQESKPAAAVPDP